jgi:type I restriction enzyme M protein
MIREIKHINPFAALEEQVWQTFDVLRNGQLTSEEYYVVLFLLLLQRDGILDEVNVSESNLASQIRSRISALAKSKPKEGSALYEILKRLESLLHSIGNGDLKELIEKFRLLNKKELKKEFAELYDGVLYKLAKSQGRIGGEVIQPIELTRFICAQSKLSQKAKVYNPFAGLASFGVFLDEGQEYLGQELHPRTWAIGALRIMAYKRPGNSNFIIGDSISDWNPKSEKYDLIIANPPFGLKLSKPISGQFGNITTYTQFIIEKGLVDLTQKGKLILVIPQGFLFNGGAEGNLRKHLVDSDLLEMVVSFPGGLLMSTTIPIAVIVINKHKTHKGVVRFIDASKAVETTSTKEKRLNDYALNTIANRTADSDSLRMVQLDEIKESDYNLTPARYFQKEVIGVRLQDLVVRVRGDRPSSNEEVGRFVRIRDLKDDRLNYNLDFDQIDSIEIPSVAFKISESVVLFATRWKTLKPSYFKFEGKPIYISPDIIALRVDENQIDIAYLINELHSEYVENQVNILRLGATIPMIRTQDLLSIKIQLPPIEEQRAKIQGAKEALLEIKKKQLEEEAKRLGVDRRIFSEFASLKHTLGTPLQNILSTNNVLLSFLENGNSDSIKQLKEQFKQSLDEDLVELVRSVKNEVNFISDLLERGEQGLILHNHYNEIIPIPEIEQVISNLKNARFKFTIKVNGVNVEGRDDIGIRTNLTLLKVMIGNVLDNVDKYGFDKRGVENEVVIDLNVLEDNFILDIKNNGKPFPRGYDKEKFITKYLTSNPGKGSGIGGYDINRIAEYFEASWDLILDEDKIFPVRFNFRFPLFAIT